MPKKYCWKLLVVARCHGSAHFDGWKPQRPGAGRPIYDARAIRATISGANHDEFTFTDDPGTRDDDGDFRLFGPAPDRSSPRERRVALQGRPLRRSSRIEGGPSSSRSHRTIRKLRPGGTTCPVPGDAGKVWGGSHARILTRSRARLARVARPKRKTARTVRPSPFVKSVATELTAGCRPGSGGTDR